ncbi:MAG: histidine kinase [Oscillospiraceae bacterium]|nr:histidine kinase [Oscillospiraceae bacterium]
MSVKMMLLFSVMMFTSLLILSSIALRTMITGANAFTEVRFQNMSMSIVRDIQQDFSMMQLTMDELLGDTSFMSALNQAVRDDSEDQKMGQRARETVVSKFYQSPLVDNYYRISFYTRDGLFITSRADKTDTLVSGTAEAKAVINALPWLDQADAAFSHVILAPHQDYLSAQRETMVYSIVRRVFYQGKQIGYIEISNEYTDLQRIMGFVDDPAVVVQAVFNDGSLFFSSADQPLSWPTDLPTDILTTVGADAQGEEGYSALHTAVEALGLHLFIAESSAVSRMGNEWLGRSAFTQSLYVILPTLVIIALLSVGLTRSIRKLTKRVRQISAKDVFSSNGVATQELTATITSPSDHETHELEQAFNSMMLRLQDSVMNETTLREGTLQAQLSALQAQINPHFIYNTLNIISAKSMESGNYDVIEICDQFAQLLRYSTDTRAQTASISEEIENVRNYLLLAKARYEDYLEYTIDVPADLGSISVPKLTLQPIVENALTHGFDGKNVLRKLSVSGHVQQGQLILEIRDNGAGFSEEMLQNLHARIEDIQNGQRAIDKTGGHIGLVNTYLRLYYYSNGAIRMAMRNEEGAVVTITIPVS